MVIDVGMSSFGKSVRIFLVDGSPGGLLTAEIVNWTGQVIAAPRSDLVALLKRPEVRRTGIYLLIGDDPDSLGGLLAYVGEGDDVGTRLIGHAREETKGGKDFWDHAIVLTSKDANLTKAHARYLESRFVQLAALANRAKLVNGNVPSLSVLPEADLSDMEGFIAQAMVLLPVLGVNLFRSVATSIVRERVETANSPRTHLSPVFELQIKKDGLVASAQEADGEFTVLKGSLARLKWIGDDGGYKGLREKLEEDGTLILTDNGQRMAFEHDQVFASPSAAAATVTGRRANGRTAWRTIGDGQSYGDWQIQGVDQSNSEIEGG